MKFIIDKSIFFLVVTLVFVSCKPAKIADKTSIEKAETKKETKKYNTVYYSEQVKNDFRAVTENAQFKFLQAYNATEKQYGILFFTQGFNGEEIVVKNDNETLFKGSVLTNKRTGLAKNMRIINTEETSIYDKATKKTIYIKGDKARKHKFIYIMKGNANEDKPYKITYSDKLRPEK